MGTERREHRNHHERHAALCKTGIDQEFIKNGGFHDLSKGKAEEIQKQMREHYPAAKKPFDEFLKEMGYAYLAGKIVNRKDLTDETRKRLGRQDAAFLALHGNSVGPVPSESQTPGQSQWLGQAVSQSNCFSRWVCWCRTRKQSIERRRLHEVQNKPAARKLLQNVNSEAIFRRLTAIPLDLDTLSSTMPGPKHHFANEHRGLAEEETPSAVPHLEIIFSALACVGYV